MIITFVAFIVSLIISFALVPILARFAHRVGLVDHPDKHRKLHRDAIPMVGGLALLIASSVTVAAMIGLSIFGKEFLHAVALKLSPWIPIQEVVLRPYDLYQLLGLWIGSVILVTVGVIDDRFGLGGKKKLLGQLVAATVLVYFGYQFNYITFAGMKIVFGTFSILVIYAWVIAAINSVNLLDGADGIAATIGIVMSLAICAMSMVLGKTVDAMVAATIAGALFGFLKYNFPPAKIYLGDAGSMLIGFLLSALAIRCMFKQTSAYAFFAPIALLAIPFIDTTAAIIRRRLMGRSIFAVDRGHLHHTLMKQGYSPRISLLWVALLCSTTAAGGVMSLIYQQSEYALVSIALVLIVMVGFKVFGVAELELVSRKAGALANALVNKKDSSDIQQSAVHVQGNRDWQHVWKLLSDFSDEHGLNQITLDINAPWLHESFHATRRRKDAQRGGITEWHSLIPLVIEEKVFGRVEIQGTLNTTFSHHDVLQNILKVTADIEQFLLDPLPPVPPPSPSDLEKKTEPSSPSDLFLVEASPASKKI